MDRLDNAPALGFATGERLATAIRSTLTGGRADLAVAFWGGEAADLIGLPSDAKAVRVACDAFSGSCNPEAVVDLLRRGAKVFDSPGLHAKVYMGAGTLVVGSANASTNGIGKVAEGELALEAALVSRDRAEIVSAQDWLDKVFREGVPLTTADLPRLKKRWSQRPKAPKREPSRRFLEMLRGEPEWFQGRRLRVFIYDSEEPDAEIELAYRESPFFESQESVDDVRWPYYWSTGDWDVTQGDLILDFIRVREKVRCTGVWRVLGQIQGGNITAVEFVEKPLGLSFPWADYAKLATNMNKKNLFQNDHFWKLLDIVPIARELR